MKISDPIIENNENNSASLSLMKKKTFLVKRDNESIWKNNEKTFH